MEGGHLYYSADPEHLGRFLGHGERYVADLEAIGRRVEGALVFAGDRFDRQSAGPSALASIAELIAEARLSNAYVAAVKHSLETGARVESVLAELGFGTMGDGSAAADRTLLARIENSGLWSEIGRPPVSDDALSELAAWMSDNGVDELNNEELNDLAAGRTGASQRVEASARYLLDNPDLLASIGGTPGGGRLPYRGKPIPSGVSVEQLEQALAVNRAVQVLSDQAVFDRLDTDGNRHLSPAELGQAPVVLPGEDAAALAVLTVDRPTSGHHLDRSDPTAMTALARAADRLGVGGDLVGVEVSYPDVVAAAVNRRVFVNDPAGARDFVLQLETSADEVRGGDGYDVRLVGDAGLRGLAGAALGGADGLLEETLVVAHLPESAGGVRNALITAYYARLGREMNERMNAGLPDSGDPRSGGHTGANWLVFGAHASNGVRGAITGEFSALGLGPSESDRQAAADGNQYIFATVAPVTAAFLDAFPAQWPVTSSGVERFFGRLELAEEDLLFREGMADLRDAFVFYTAAMEEIDPRRRQELTFSGNLAIQTFEQAGAQRWIDRLLDLGLDDGPRGLLEPLTAIVGGDDVIATSFLDMSIGIETEAEDDDSKRLELDRDVLAGDHTNNGLMGRPLIGFDPTREEARVVTVGSFTVDLDRSRGDVNLPPLGGWGDPPPGTGMSTFPVSVAEWRRGGEGTRLVGAGGVVEEPTGSGDGIDLGGTGAIRWNDWEDRQWFIVNFFHQHHTDPVVFDNLSDFAPGRSDLSFEEALPSFLPARVIDGLAKDS